MLRYRQFQRHPRALLCLTGLKPLLFQRLCQRLEPLWQEAERQRKQRPDRRRAIGAGHPYRLPSLADKLLLFLTLCRQGLTYQFAGILFGMDTSNVRRLFLRLAPLVEAAADPDLLRFGLDVRLALQQRREGMGQVGDWETLLQRCPELAEVAVDSTEQPRQRPKDPGQRRQYYSGKSKRHTLKTLLVVVGGKKRAGGTKRAGGVGRGRILFVSPSHPGSTSDQALYRHQRLAQRIPPPTRQFIDGGFGGVDKAYPRHDIRLPYRRPSPGCQGRGQRGGALSPRQKRANRRHRRRRVVVEHALAGMKRYRLLRDTWRSRPQRHTAIFRAVAALTNFRLAA